MSGSRFRVPQSGKQGSQVFTFENGTSIDDIVNAVNLVSDATGVTAGIDATTGNLALTSTDYGSSGFVSLSVIKDDGTFKTNLDATRDTGTDAEVKVNGITAKSDGNKFSISTATLSFSATVADGTNTAFDFLVTGGGAQFQLGPDVVTNQQARIGIQSVSTGTLGGANGRLYELASGQDAALAKDTALASRIVNEVVGKVSSLRGRLGAFQKTTLDSNISSLNDTLENLTAARSSITDADFAAESANLTRAQILVQSGTSVLAIANQSPQNVLALLK